MSDFYLYKFLILQKLFQKTNRQQFLTNSISTSSNAIISLVLILFFPSSIIFTSTLQTNQRTHKSILNLLRQKISTLDFYQLIHFRKNRHEKDFLNTKALKLIGCGGYGIIVSLRHLPRYVFKVARPEKIEALKSEKENNETLMRKIKRKDGLAYLTTYFGNFYDKAGKEILCFERIKGQPVYKWLKTNPSNTSKLHIFIQITKAIQAMHKAGFIHRDIKLNNFIIQDSSRPKVKIIDQGFTYYPSNQKKNKLFGTYNYMAPELVNDYVTKTNDSKISVQNEKAQKTLKEAIASSSLEEQEKTDVLELLTNYAPQAFDLPLDQIIANDQHFLNLCKFYLPSILRCWEKMELQQDSNSPEFIKAKTKHETLNEKYNRYTYSQIFNTPFMQELLNRVLTIKWFPENWRNESLKKLIIQCLNSEPNLRPPIEQIVTTIDKIAKKQAQHFL